MKTNAFAFFLTVVFLGACSSPEGTVFHPDTDLTQFSDQKLFNAYQSLQIVIERDEKELAAAEAGDIKQVGLAGILTAGVQREDLEKNKGTMRRILKELRRRDITPQDAIEKANSTNH